MIVVADQLHESLEDASGSADFLLHPRDVGTGRADLWSTALNQATRLTSSP